MKKFNINRKAFTLTELIVVIAIIGILSVVMIPVLTGCIEDAKISNDTVLVANINKVLSANEILDGRNKTAHEAINDAFEAGYGIEKLTPTSNKCYFMWDAKYDEFVLTNESFGEIYPKNKERAAEDLFGLVANKNDIDKLKEKGHSIYLKDNFPISEITVNSIIEIDSGLDVGNNIGIDKVLYQNEKKIKDVIIRTNGGELTINAPLDTVKHYGEAIKVSIDAVANKSYHEFGEVVGDILISQGNVVVESQGVVNTVILNGPDAQTTIESGALVSAVASTREGNKENITNNNGENTIIVVDTIIPTTDFAGGLGTETSPYLIANEEQWEKLVNSDKTFRNDGHYFNVISDLDFSNITSLNDYETKFVVKDFNGTVDFKHHNVYYVSCGEQADHYELFKNSESRDIKISISNLNAYFNDRCTLLFSEYYNKQEININNTTVYGNIQGAINDGNGYALFVSWDYPTESGSKITLTNCINNANVTAFSDTAGIFVGYSTNICEYNFINCVNNGSLVNVKGKASMLINNGSYLKKPENDKLNINISNCVNNGIITGNTGANLVCCAANPDVASKINNNINDGTFNIINKNVGICHKIETKQLVIDNDLFVLPPVNGAAYYKLNFTARYNTGNGAITSISARLTEEELSSLVLKAYPFVTGKESLNNTGATSIQVGDAILYCKEGKYLFINSLTEGEKYIISQPTITFIAYSEDGVILDSYIYNN